MWALRPCCRTRSKSSPLIDLTKSIRAIPEIIRYYVEHTINGRWTFADHRKVMCPGSIPGDPLFLSFFVPSCKRHPAPNGCLYFIQNRGDTMARAPDQRVQQAEAMFLTGKKLVEIANELNLPEGTVRRWKSTYKWESERSESKSERSDKKANVRKEKKKAVAEEVMQVIENPDLTDKQRLFCVLYVKCFNATKAAIKAGYSSNTAMEQGYQLLHNPSVREEIMRLKQHRLNRELLDEHDIFQKYMDIAYSDITDYVEFGREEIQAMGAFGPIQVEDPETGKKVPLMKIVNSVRFRESDMVDGTIITEVKQGKDGASIKLADRMKALEWIANHMDMATEEQRARIAQVKAQTDKLTGNNQEIEDLEEIEGGIYGTSQ